MKENPHRIVADAAGAEEVDQSEQHQHTTPPPSFQSTGTLLDRALAYARCGLHVFPLYSTRDGRCTCGHDCGKNAAKHPRVKGGYKVATVDARQIEAWWHKWPDANVGIATGSISGIVVIDIDGAEGLASLQEIVNRHGPLPRTAMVRTTRGWHLYFRVPTGTAISCSTGRGLDVRGDGGYVAAPPSVHATGHVYQWCGDAVA
jgi:putative DNA primase/helicase